MPAWSAMRPLRRPSIARRCAPIRRTTNCWIARSSPRSRMADIDDAVKLADRTLTVDKSNRVARLVVGVRDLKQKKYAAAQLINQSICGPITDLVATLLSGWASYGAGDTKSAVASIDKLTGPEWYPDLQGPAFRHDARRRRRGKRRRHPLRAGLQARRIPCCGWRIPRALAIAQQA